MTQNTQTESPYLFIEELYTSNPNREIIVAKKDWFETVKVSDTYDNNGMQTDPCECSCDCCFDEDGDALGFDCHDCENKNIEDCENNYELEAYTFWNGSNHQTIVLESEFFDTPYSIIDDDKEITQFTDIIEKAETDDDYPWKDGSAGYKSCNISGYQVTQSFWQGNWSLYEITLLEDKD